MRVRGGHAGAARPALALVVAEIAAGTLLLFSVGLATRGVSAARAVPVARATVSGRLLSGHRPLGHIAVDLYTTPGRAAGGAPRLLARGVTRAGGSFSLAYTSPQSRYAVGYILARTGRTVRSATTLGTPPFPRTVVLNERTTVATAYALAQFVVGDRIAGKAPGLQNGAAMVRDFAELRTGGLSRVLSRAPNGAETSTLPTFDSLANLATGCARSVAACRPLLRLARLPGEPAPRGVLTALSAIARNPGHNVVKLSRLARTGPVPYRPALRPTQAPDAWTLALRFVGDDETMSGPGNMAIDARGNVWSTNNYVYSRDPAANVCGAKSLLKFTPTGQYVSGSPYYGGGLNGAGFGITLDPFGRVWVGNFGFSAVKCKAPPPHNSVSAFTPAGRPISPSATGTSTGGFTQGAISWPQGTVSDRHGNIWIANCGNNSVTRYAAGDPAAARSIPLPIAKPFDIAFNLQGQAFVTGDGDSAVEMLNPDGTYALSAPITGGGLDKPMGIAADIEGNMWVANSGFADVPCPSGGAPSRNHPASITLITSTGKLAARQPFTGGGLTAPWGVAVDGQDHVWVTNFGGQRLSEFCGVERAKCPRGMNTGEPISPSTGYGFDGLVRNTGVQVDPSGNVWVANNWKTNPLPRRNPGGYQMVVFVGLASPLRTPLIGPPNPL
jgi:sugar lactone lactonase YvrE